MKKRTETRKHYDNFCVAGLTYCDAPLVLDSMRVGEIVELEEEPNNQFDPYAVAIYYRDTKIGYVPREHNQELSKILETGHGDIFEARINTIDPTAHLERRVGITLYLKIVDNKREE